MAYYLQMDGVDDKIVTPSLTFTKIVMDFKPLQAGSTHYYMDLRDASNTSPYLFRSASNDTWVGLTLKVDGVSKTSGTVAIPNNTRCSLEIITAAGAQTRTGLYFLSRFTSANYLAAYVYDIKIYNSVTLVAQYDCTLGNVQDQSGNGNHATLTGGTWVSEGGTTHEASATLQGTGSLTASGTLYKLGEAALQGTSSLTATAEKTLIASANLQGNGSLSAVASLTIIGGASLTGTSTLTATAVSGVQIVRMISLLGALPSPIQLLGGSVASINLLGSTVETIALQGGTPSIIALEGGIMATKTKQDFTMYQGDTPPLTFTIDTASLSGATLKWVVRKGHVKGPQVIFKDTTDGLTVSGLMVTVNLETTDTATLEGKFYHELELTDVSGKVSTSSTGEITILPSGA